jgi:UDP-N-acetylglucosamine 2-epimerase
MDEFNRLFEIDHKHCILICLSCQYAVVPFQVKMHLQTYHRRINLQQRKYIISEIEATTELARTHAEVIYPTISYVERGTADGL